MRIFSRISRKSPDVSARNKVHIITPLYLLSGFAMGYSGSRNTKVK